MYEATKNHLLIMKYFMLRLKGTIVEPLQVGLVREIQNYFLMIKSCFNR